MKAPLLGNFTLSSLASTPNASRCSASRKSVFVDYRIKGKPWFNFRSVQQTNLIYS